MNASSFKMKRLLSASFSLFLAAFVALALSACTETQTSDTGDTTGVGGAVTGEGGLSQQEGVGGGLATVQTTISLLRQGVTAIPVNQAVRNINSWEQRLQQVQVEGQAQQTVSNITDNLGHLKSELQADQIDGQAVGNLLTQLGEQTSQAAQAASGQTVQQLQQLGQVLTQSGNRLTSGGQ